MENVQAEIQAAFENGRISRTFYDLSPADAGFDIFAIFRQVFARGSTLSLTTQSKTTFSFGSIFQKTTCAPLAG